VRATTSSSEREKKPATPSSRRLPTKIQFRHCSRLDLPLSVQAWEWGLVVWISMEMVVRNASCTVSLQSSTWLSVLSSESKEPPMTLPTCGLFGMTFIATNHRHHMAFDLPLSEFRMDNGIIAETTIEVSDIHLSPKLAFGSSSITGTI
jgi:hypothetical protein